MDNTIIVSIEFSSTMPRDEMEKVTCLFANKLQRAKWAGQKTTRIEMLSGLPLVDWWVVDNLGSQE